MSLTLAVINAHIRPDILEAQIRNYNAAFNGNIIHGVNINAAFESKFWEAAKLEKVDLSSLGNVFFNCPSTETSYGSILHAYLRTVMYALREGINFDYVYFHTPADLLIRRDVDVYISSCDIGFPSPYEYPFDEQHHFIHHHGKDPWVDKMAMNPAFFEFLKTLGHAVAHRVRTEGMFFKRELFFEILYPLLLEGGVGYVERAPKAYPFEETELASCFEFYRKRVQKQTVRNLIHVVEDKQVSGVEIIDVEEALTRNDVYGIKRVPDELDADVRKHIAHLVGE